jgi:hypothetical protein
METDCQEEEQTHEEKQHDQVSHEIGKSCPPMGTLFLMKFKFAKI